MTEHDDGQRSQAPSQLLDQVALLPDQPGVYLFRGAGGEVLYVGKAQSLRTRVRSYFQAARTLEHRKESMVEQASSIDYIATASAVEALILEANLIKKHHPRYNIRLRDDKQYPYVRVGLNDEYPSVTLVRRREADGARYFGPYTQSHALRETLRTLRRIFPYRSCPRVVPRDRPCLNRFIGRCLGPCQGDVEQARYGEMIDSLILFMSGRDDQVRGQLRQRMEDAAGELAFERAAAYRDQLRLLEAFIGGQQTVTTDLSDRDVVALAADPVQACAQVFYFRGGRLVGRDVFYLRGAATGAEQEAMSAFLSQYYSVAADIPGEILLSHRCEDQQVLEQWLSQLRGKRVKLRTPQRGEGLRLVRLASDNAELALREKRAQRDLDPATLRDDLVILQDLLGLDEYPHRIECYDISNTSGQQAVASMVVFEGGQAKRADYRRFRLRTPGPDDYGMMAEAIERRLRRSGGDDQADSFAVLPDLIIVDGGRGQARAAAAVLAREGMGQLPVFGLAKEHELLYSPEDELPVALPVGSGALHVLMRLRDEAHRFAVSYHRKLRAKKSLRSVLDDIPGVGARRRTTLLRHFGSGRAVAAATLEQLLAVPGLPRTVAEAIHDRFHPPAPAQDPLPDDCRNAAPNEHKREDGSKP